MPIQNFTIAAAWEQFEQRAVPKDAPEVQRDTMKQCFYAGASVLLRYTWELGASEMSEDASCAVLNGLHQEITNYSQELLKRGA